MNSLDLKDFLGAFPRVEGSGEPIPISYEKLRANIETLDASRSAYEIIRELDIKKWIKVLPDGGRTLTSEGLALWEKIPSSRVVPAKNADESEWQDFRRLLGYYIECARATERKQEFIHYNERGLEWLVPALPSFWAEPFENKIVAEAVSATGMPLDANGRTCEFEIPVPREDKIAVARLIANSSDIFLGYPVADVWLKNPAQKTPDFSPIFMIPTKVSPTISGSLRLRIDFAGTRINYEWFEFASKNNYNARGVDERIFDPITKEFDLDAALNFVSKICNADSDTIDPSRLNSDLNSFEKGCHKVRNTAILFVSESLKYGKNLVAELVQIRDTSADELDKTALAYIFRKHVKSGAQLGKFGVPVAENRSRREVVFPFVPMSDTQMVATERAFSEPLVVVTGPPGTGKSQVVANIIGNSVWRGESVLFTTKNHKAIDAVRGKCDSIRQAVALDSVSQNDPTIFVEDDTEWRKFAEEIYNRAESTLEDLRKGYRGDPAKNYVEFLSNCKTLVELLNASVDRSETTSDCEVFWEYANDDFPKTFSSIKTSILNTARGNEKEALDVLSAAEKVFSFYRDSGSRAWFTKIILKTFKRISSCEKIVNELFGLSPSDYQKKPTFCEERLSEINTIRKMRAEFISLTEKKEKTVAECASLAKKAGIDDIDTQTKQIWETFYGEKSDGNANSETKTLTLSFSEAFRRAFASSRCRTLEDFSREELDKIKACVSVLSNYSSRSFSEKDKLEARAIYSKLLKLAPAWARTLLSLWRAVPCVPAILDRVIIDEAGQCDVASCIPALFRAKRAVVVGDPDQFPPVVDFPEPRNEVAKKRFSISESLDAFDFRASNFYSIGKKKLLESCLCARGAIFLEEHFRCDAEQMAYFNDVFYKGRLLARAPKRAGEHGVVWHDVKGGVDAEVFEAVSLLKELQNKLPTGTTFGVIAPLCVCRDKLIESAMKGGIRVARQQGEGKKNSADASDSNAIPISTVNGFQGGERDVIIFVLGLSEDLKRGQKWYIESLENKYIFNVAISRARACAHVIGNRDLASKSPLEALRKLATPPIPKQTQFDSLPEQMLYEALKKAGIKTIPQFPLSGRFLDLAVVERKIDIEVDGARWHTYSDGRRKMTDYQRDYEISCAGWSIVRVWAREVFQDIDECVKKIKDAM